MTKLENKEIKIKYKYIKKRNLSILWNFIFLFEKKNNEIIIKTIVSITAGPAASAKGKNDIK
tara:strand:- start:421 stop:606 length:186 start_codon:yes stop_codon:yes gene_type:complete